MKLTTIVMSLALLAIPALAGEKALMHCFAFTEKAEGTPADWDAFKKATDALPGQIPGVMKVWHGKLRNPLAQIIINPEAGKALREGGKDVDAKANRLVRSYGVCMEMKDAATFETYGKNPAHAEWRKAYEKIMVPGTTTYQILGN